MRSPLHRVKTKSNTMIAQFLTSTIVDEVTTLFWMGEAIGVVFPDSDEWVAFDGIEERRFPYPSTAERYLISTTVR
jgi:hypothetical protein